MSVMHDIALSGHFGENNVGDDILLLSLVAGLSKTLNVGELVIFTADVGKTVALLDREKMNGEYIRIIYSGRWGVREPGKSFFKSFSWLAATVTVLKKASLHLIGPGTIIKDSNRFFVAFWLLRAFLSYLLRRPFAFIGIGVGDVRFFHSRLLIWWLVNKAQFVTVRDTGSLEELKTLHVDRPFMASFPDLSFAGAFPSVKAYGANQIAKIGLNFRKFKIKHFSVGVIRSYENSIINLLLKMPKNMELVFYSFCNETHQSDLDMFERITTIAGKHQVRITNLIYTNLAELRNSIAACDVFIGTRYHSVLLAIQEGVPSVGLSYERKTVNFMQDAGLSDFALDVNHIRNDSLVCAWEKVVDGYVQYKSCLEGIRKSFGSRSMKHFDVVSAALSQDL